jgi:hypothetical protein
MHTMTIILNQRLPAGLQNLHDLDIKNWIFITSLLNYKSWCQEKIIATQLNYAQRN